MNIKNLLEIIGFNNFIALDLETTGLNKNRDEIIEISALRFINGELSDEFTTLIKPKQSIQKKITDITGINDSLVSDAPIIDEVVDDFFSFIDNGIIVAHNAEFDLGFIEECAKKTSKKSNIKAVCDTLLLSRSFLFFLDKFNLEYLSDVFELDHTDAHRARSDAFNTGKIFIQLIQQIISTPIEVINDIKKISSGKNIYNSILYANISKMLKNTPNNKFLPIMNFAPKDNVLIYKDGSDDDFLEDINSWFDKGGKISNHWNDYELRESQMELSQDIYSNFKDNSILIAEAGAGLGKSLAYLIAGLKYAKESKKKLVISTYTKSLQNQLFDKDIPVLTHSLNLNLKAVILKGKNNYISKINLKSIIDRDYIFMKDKDINDCITLIVWSYFTKTGDIEECNGIYREKISYLWNKLTYPEINESDFDRNQYGLFPQNDYYNKVIKELKNSDIIIINHSLLCSDISNDSPSLPEKSLLIIDEGHNLINAIRNQLTESFSDAYLINLFYSLIGVINNLKKYDNQFLDSLENINTLTNQLIIKTNQFFDELKFNYEEIYSNLDFNRYDINISNENFLMKEFNFNLLLSDINELLDNIDSILPNRKNKVSTINNDFQFRLIITNLTEVRDILKNFIDDKSKYIKWLSLYRANLNNRISLYTSDMDIKNFISNKIMKYSPSFFLCSATLTITDSFEFFLNNLGINNNFNYSINTQIYKSPFYYDEQSKFYIYNQKIDINSNEYLDDVSKQITSINNSLNKKILVLCTSYKQVKLISQNLLANNINSKNIFDQTSRFSKQAILEGYKKSKKGILIGTATFWEGIDLIGDLLEILFIVRIPFGNPSNPYNQNLNSMIQASGGNPFYDLELPNAILKIKQGTGRLIRSDKDNGVCLITDPRLCNSRYGKFIVDEIVSSPNFYKNIDEIINEIDNFLG